MGDIKEAVESHKPNFVKAPRRVFEKHDGYYSEEEKEEEEDDKEDKKEACDSKSISNERSDTNDNETSNKTDENLELKSLKFVSNNEPEGDKRSPINTVKDGFKRVTRAEWNKMSFKEKKKYLKERRKRKQHQTVFIKDDSDNEQLS